MIKSGFSYLKLTAVVAIMAMALIPSMRRSTAKSQPSPVATVAAGVDLANERRVLAKYFDDLVAYYKQAAELRKRERLVSADLDPLQRKSADLKGRLSGLQNTIREIVRKLKAANEWNDLDTSVAAKITDARRRSFFQQTSFKQLLEEFSNNLTSQGNEINIPLDNLRKKLTSRTLSPYGDGADLQIVRAAYEAPAPVRLVSSACGVGKLILALFDMSGQAEEIAPKQLFGDVECFCSDKAPGNISACEAL